MYRTVTFYFSISFINWMYSNIDGMFELMKIVYTTLKSQIAISIIFIDAEKECRDI